VTANVTGCGDGNIDRPNSAGQMEQCEADADCPQGQTCVQCVCIAGELPPEGTTHKACSGERCINVQGAGESTCTTDEQCRMPVACGNGKIEGTEQCDIGAQMINGVQYPAARDTCQWGDTCRSDCTCKPGAVTPRCGDGYISHLLAAGGGAEECDLGGKYDAPNLTDTCEPPSACSRITCRCELPPQEDDGIHYSCVEGGCIAQDGEGPNECLRNDQCRHSVCGTGGVCTELMYKGEDECDTNAQCRHSICEEGQCNELLEPGTDECDVDSDCSHYSCLLENCVLIDMPGQDSCHTDADCVVEYCGNGRRDPGEDCDGEGPCGVDGVCSDCKCVEPPDLNCGSICGETSGAELIQQGLSNSALCSGAVSGYYESMTCYTTCTYSWFYRVDNVAGYDSCCCGAVYRERCSDCPGQNPVCPPESICSQHTPSWYSP